MTHFGIIAPPVSGHTNPLAALGRELRQRGNHITFFQIPDLESKILQEELNFSVIGKSDHPHGSLSESIAKLGKLSGIEALRFTIKAIQKTTNMICRDGPSAIREAGVEVLLVDQTEPAGATVAEYLQLPFITICCALAINRELSIPPMFTSWDYHDVWWAHLRNQLGYSLFDFITQPIQTVLAEYRQKWDLPAYKNQKDSFSHLAQISQQFPEFDFPRTTLPANFYYTGPFRNPSPQSVPFPYERLTGEPLIYASLGTLQNTKKELFYQIAAACEKLNVQLVISHGGGMSVQDSEALPGSPLVVSYAPQLELLARASLTITHAGLNTVLDSLSNGVPMIAIPITFEQPGIAARLRWVGAGEILPLNRVSVPRLRTVIQQILRDDSYRRKAANLKNSIQKAGGVKQAVRYIEEALKFG